LKWKGDINIFWWCAKIESETTLEQWENSYTCITVRENIPNSGCSATERAIESNTMVLNILRMLYKSFSLFIDWSFASDHVMASRAEASRRDALAAASFKPSYLN